MRSKLIIGLAVFITIVIVSGLAIKIKNSTQGKDQNTEITNDILPINLRPYLTIASAKSPLNNSFDGKFFVMEIANVPSDSTVDYELVYETATVPKGFADTARLENGRFKREEFFGTKSTKDYHFDSGVEFGKTTLEISSDKNEYEMIANFRLQKVGSAKTVLSSQDNNYQLEIPQGALKNTAVIFQQTVGLPKVYSGVFLIDQPIAFLTQASSTLSKPASLKIKVDKNSSGKVVIVGFNQQDGNWKEFETSFDPQTQIASATVDLLSTYIVVEKTGN